MKRPEIWDALPPGVRWEAEEEPALREIHLRRGRPTELLCGERSRLLRHCASGEELQLILETASAHSLYAVQEQLREGFCTTRDGCRIGVAGTVALDRQGIRSIRSLSSLTIRMAAEARGTAASAAAAMGDEPGSALILGPPGCGKTTLLRDLIRIVSDDWGQRVAVADCRMELAAASDGVPGLYLGKRTDILSGGEKEEAILLLLRTMNPRWIAADEITSPRDAAALERCAGCGVHLLATVHAFDRRDLRQRPVCRSLLEGKLFRYLIEMEGPGRYRTRRMEECDV